MKISEKHITPNSRKSLKEAIKSVEEKTVEFFKWKFDKDINIEEARQINERVTVVFTLLAKWDRKQRLSGSAKRILLIKKKIERIIFDRPFIVISLPISV